MPVTVICDLEHYEFARPERVHDRQRHSRHERAEKASPHRFYAEIVAHFLCRLSFIGIPRKGLQDAPQWRREHHL